MMIMEFLETVHQERVRILRQLPKADIVLDLGCAGYPLSIDYPYPARIIGINLPDAQLAKVSKEGFREDFIGGDASILPFRDSFFDLVVAGQLIEHIPNYRALLSEAVRVLKPGGHLLIDTPNFNITERIEKIIQKNNPGWKHGQEVGHVHEFQYQELKGLLSEFDLKICWEAGVYLPIDTLLFGVWAGRAWDHASYRWASMRLGRYTPSHAYLMSFLCSR